MAPNDPGLHPFAGPVEVPNGLRSDPGLHPFTVPAEDPNDPAGEDDTGNITPTTSDNEKKTGKAGYPAGKIPEDSSPIAPDLFLAEETTGKYEIWAYYVNLTPAIAPGVTREPFSN